MIKTKLDGANVYRFYEYDDRLPEMVIYRLGFTGHRDWFAEPLMLQALTWAYGGAVWVDGGAFTGFDAQVHNFTLSWRLTEEQHRPDYAAFPDRPKYAPIHRNRTKIVDTVDCLVGLWDGRESGGTYDTLCYADERNLPIILLRPHVKVPNGATVDTRGI